LSFANFPVALQELAQPPTSAMQSHARRAARTAHDLRDLAEVKPLPGHEQQQLSITVCHLRQRGSHLAGLRRIHPRAAGGVAQAIGQRPSPSSPAAMIRQCPPGTPQKPRQSLIRNVLKTTARHHEHLHHHVIRDICIRTTPRVRVDIICVLVVQLFNAPTSLRLHDCIMSSNRPIFTPRTQDFRAHRGGALAENPDRGRIGQLRRLAPRVKRSPTGVSGAQPDP
jgi:hypothetical protein